MQAKDLSQFKTKLEKKREGLLKEITAQERVTDFGSDIDSLEEETQESEKYGEQLSVAQTLKGRVADIDTALRKIEQGEQGTYGKCESCGREISMRLLEIDPESRLCQECKTRSKTTNQPESTK